MKRRGGGADIVQLFQQMARDEARHAGFIDDALRGGGIAVNLGFLIYERKHIYFRPKYISCATPAPPIYPRRLDVRDIPLSKDS